jgi:TetR/AcrR family transcriptional regulator, transcriptional repressor for nem operon
MNGHIISTMVKPNIRERLLSAGLHTLHTRGFNAASVQDITEAAGVPKGSFYNHFDSKEALGAAVVGEYAQQASERLPDLHDPALPPLPRLRHYFDVLIQSIIDSDYQCGCLLGNFSAELSHQSPLISAQVAFAMAGWSDEIALVIEEAQRGGALLQNQSAKALAVFIMNAWQGALLRARAEKQPESLRLFAEMVFTRILAMPS